VTADDNWAGEHRWTDAGDGEPHIEVRHVQPYQAEKTYRCPGCDHEIRPGEGHEVVIPLDAPRDRRHWHTGCWHGERRRKPGAERRPG
jgi:hypothetical protein